MDTIENHIEQDKKILEDPSISPQQRRHIEGELGELEAYKAKHPDDHRDPSSLELFCDSNPNALECRIYED
jgi:hypothetical protein